MDTKTLLQNSPPGYFDGSELQSEMTVKIFDWFTRYKNLQVASANNFDTFYRLYLSIIYEANDSTEFLRLQLERYGLKNISLLPEELKKILIWVSTPKKRRLSENLQEFIDFLFSIEWISAFEDIKIGYSSPAKYAEIFIMFSDSLTLPATPSSQEYFPKVWLAPSGWTKIPSSSNYYVRGYLYEGYIIWSDPIPTSQVVLYSTATDLLDLPLSPSLYDIAIVTDDSTGDFQSIYYFDGVDWIKNNTENDLQGLVGVDNSYDSSLVYAPPDTDLISSETQPPVDGNTEGFGFYGIWGLGTIARFIVFTIVLTDNGNTNLGLIVQLIKKIKPLGSLSFFINAVYEETTTQILVKDYNAVY